jgi:hypothetical protein
VLLFAFLAGIPGVRAQSQPEQSVAEAARKAREQKKTAAKPTTVITNDTLQPATPATVQNATAATESLPGTNPSADAAADAAANAAQPAKESSEEDLAAKKAKIESLKQQIADKAHEADVQQRALALANESYYSRPDFSKDPDGKAKLDAMQSDLAQKKEELAQLKAKLKELAPEADQKPAAPQQ